MVSIRQKNTKKSQKGGVGSGDSQHSTEDEKKKLYNFIQEKKELYNFIGSAPSDVVAKIESKWTNENCPPYSKKLAMSIIKAGLFPACWNLDTYLYPLLQEDNLNEKKINEKKIKEKKIKDMLVLSYGKDVATRRSPLEGITSLIDAVENNNIDAIIGLVNAGVDMSSMQLLHAIYIAIRNNNKEIIDLLLKNAVKPAKHALLLNVIKDAVEKNDENTIKRLINDKHDISNVVELPLKIAIRNNNESMVDLLLRYGTNINATVLESAIAQYDKNQNFNLIQKLINKIEKIHYYILSLAAFHGYIDIVRALINKGVEIDPKNVPEFLNSPLASAAGNGKLDIVKLLIEKGANVKESGSKPLYLAAKRGHLDVVKELLKANANVHAKDDLALRVAALEGHLPIVETLLAAGSRINTPGIIAEIKDKKIKELLTASLTQQGGSSITYKGREYKTRIEKWSSRKYIIVGKEKSKYYVSISKNGYVSLRRA